MEGANLGLVHGQHLVVNSEAVSLSVRVRKDSCLKHLLVRWFDSWNQSARRKCDHLILQEP
eukprot:scaffold2285_cov380-Prasinococcus_capsulatus_cf.AAC.7